jgi:hypothetical protein
MTSFTQQWCIWCDLERSSLAYYDRALARRLQEEIEQGAYSISELIAGAEARLNSAEMGLRRYYGSADEVALKSGTYEPARLDKVT